MTVTVRLKSLLSSSSTQWNVHLEEEESHSDANSHPPSEACSSKNNTNAIEESEKNHNLATSTSHVSVASQRSREPCLFDPVVEEKGVADILAVFTPEEILGMSDENMPLRHFRAEKGNVDKAIVKIKSTIEWRNQFQVDRIKNAFQQDSESYPETEELRNILSKENETGKIYVRGYDTNGRALLILRPGKENTTLGHSEMNQMRHLVYFMERAIACTARKSQLEKFNILVDYKGFSVLRHSPPLSTTKHTIHILQNHYPERLFRVYVVNAPLYFRTFWKMIRPFLDPVTNDKIHLCSSGMEGLTLIQRDFDLSTMEECAFGVPGKLREYNSKEYLEQTPFDHAFDES